MLTSHDVPSFFSAAAHEGLHARDAIRPDIILTARPMCSLRGAKTHDKTKLNKPASCQQQGTEDKGDRVDCTLKAEGK